MEQSNRTGCSKSRSLITTKGSALHATAMAKSVDGMRFEWLEDIPLEVRYQCYAEIFHDGIFQVHSAPTRHCLYNQQGTDWHTSCRAILLTSKEVYTEALKMFLQTALFDVRPCGHDSRCNPLRYLCDNPQMLTQITRLLCNAGGAPQLLHLTRSTLSERTNVSRLREVIISYNLKNLDEILSLSGPDTPFRELYNKYLPSHLREFLRLFSTTTIRICAMRKLSVSQLHMKLEGERCEMLCFKEDKCIVRVPRIAVAKEIELENHLIAAFELPPSTEVVFDDASDKIEEAFVRRFGITKVA